MKFVRTIERLEDMEDLRADEPVVVYTISEFPWGEKIKLTHVGFVYNIGIDRFSLIQPILSDLKTEDLSSKDGDYSNQVGNHSKTKVPLIIRANYDWSDARKTFEETDCDYPFEENPLEHQKFRELLKQLLKERGK